MNGISRLITLSMVLVDMAIGTKLGDLANSMQVGTWRELTGTNLTAGLLFSNSDGSQNILEYCDDAQWDPVSEEFLFIGEGHYATRKFIVFNAKSNAWRQEPEPPWGGIGHGYDHSAIDVQKRLLFHRPYGNATVHKYSLDLKTWSTLPAIPANVMGYSNCCVGVDYFPDMHSLLYFSLESGSNGSLIRFNEASNQWVRVGPGKNLSCGGYQHFTEYNPVHKVFWFGGGSSTANYRVDSVGNITTLNPAPVTLGIMNTIITADPVSGLYLVFTSGGEFYTFNVLTGAWVRQSGTVPFFTPSRSGPIWCTVAAPVGSYGVNLFLKFYYGSPSQAWTYVYKHSAGTPVSGPTGRPTPEVMTLTPNPFHPETGVTFKGNASAVSVYSLEGKRIGGLIVRRSPSTFHWDPTGLPAGVYIANIAVDGSSFNKRLFLMK